MLKPVSGMVAPPTGRQELVLASIFIAKKQGDVSEKPVFIKFNAG
ncbi:hypothetical protein [Polaromonas sp. CG_9.2]|nr:hypothetical protein [Polaromonas sp. CG_9.2]